MISYEPIKIPLSKTKLILMFLGCILFIVAGLLFINNPAKYESFIMRSQTIIFFSGWASVLFFGFISFFIFKKILDKSPGVIICEEGILDNSSFVSAGFIPWGEILKIEETKVVNQKFINIIVKDIISI